MINGNNIIAVCTSRIYDHQLHDFLEQLNEYLLPHNCRMLIFALNCDLYWTGDKNIPEFYVFDIIPFDKIDCLILMDEKIKSHVVAERILAKTKAFSVPMIVIDGKYDDETSVSFDYERGFEKVVRHVIEDHKAKKPHFVAGIKGNKFSDARIEMFAKVLTENGIPFDDSMVSYGEFWADPARAAARNIIDRGDLPDAVICANDIMAINVCDVFVKAGIKVPEQVIVTGFDGIEESLFSSPAISTAGCDSLDLAEAVGGSVVALLQGKQVEDMYVMPRLQPNASCGCEYRAEANTALTSINDTYYRYQDNVREFHDISSGMQQATAPEQAASFLSKSLLMHDMCCIVNKGCFEDRENFFHTNESGSEMCLFYDSYDPGKCGESFDPEELVPEIEGRLDSGYPLIFNALDYMSKPFGYICFSFDNYHIVEYNKTASITDAVSMGIGGYVNMQYQRYLAEKITDELKAAAQMQLSMLPTNFAKHDKYEIGASMMPAKNVGGDFYDFFHIDADHLGLVMADVSGKGVPAALFMATSKMIIHDRAMLPGTPAEILMDVNRHICENNKMGLFVTVWFGILDLATGIVTYANAGHEYPAMRIGDGDYTVEKGDNLPPVGVDEDMEYENVTVDMSEGGSIFLYTDGVTDVKNGYGDHFGLEKTVGLLNAMIGCTPAEIIEGMNSGVDEFSEDADRFDDTTMMCVIYKGK